MRRTIEDKVREERITKVVELWTGKFWCREAGNFS